jgi:hypothetical protein
MHTNGWDAEAKSKEIICNKYGFWQIAFAKCLQNLFLSAAHKNLPRANLLINGGEGGIRTLGTFTRTTVFETAAFDRSATSPDRGQIAGNAP